jgi:uncharacterized 2Fe-2S/4Fe-4S cluster protein (DUF4445 family)
LPAGIEVEVEKGALLHDLIERVGTPLTLPCGGQGRCGRCLVIVKDGQVRRRSIVRLTPEEIDQGYALACQTLVEGDATVYVPPQEVSLVRPESASSAGKVAPLAITCDHARAPWIEKYYLCIEPPSLADNTADWERLQREAARQFGLRGLTTTPSVMRRLASVLRMGKFCSSPQSMRGKTCPEANWAVTIVVGRGTWAEPDALPRLVDIRPGDTTAQTFGLAVDIGTTSNVVYMADLSQGTLVDRASAYNGQITCGEDIISRIIYAKRSGGLEHLQKLVIDTINGLIDSMLARHGLQAEDIYLMTVAGNTTMIHLFLGLDPQYIRLEPYIPTVSHPAPVRAGSLGLPPIVHVGGLHIHPEATVDCLPGVGAYVGGDITAGVLRSEMSEQETVTLFIDVGTNGEIVLGNSEWLISCACSAGPAFEGSGVTSGMRATQGAIEEVWINRKTTEPTYRTIGNALPRGICGSGMISLLGEMFITGVIDKSGHLNRSLQTPRIRQGPNGPEYVVVWGRETNGQGTDIVLTEVDIQNLIRAKAAIYAGISVLASSVGLQLTDIERVLIGGAFGQYIDIEKAIQIGLLPDMPWERFAFLGNTSVQGAYLSLLCREHRAKARDIASKMTYLELSADNSFMDAFTSALFLPHTDLDSFPSIKRALAQQEPS